MLFKWSSSLNENILSFCACTFAKFNMSDVHVHMNLMSFIHAAATTATATATFIYETYNTIIMLLLI